MIPEVVWISLGLINHLRRAVLHLTQNISKTEHITDVYTIAVNLKLSVPSARNHLAMDVSNNVSDEPCCKMYKSVCFLNPYSGLTSFPHPKKAQGIPTHSGTR